MAFGSAPVCSEASEISSAGLDGGGKGRKPKPRGGWDHRFCQRHRAGPSELPSKLLLFAKSHSPSATRWGETTISSHMASLFFSSVKISNCFLSLCTLSAPIICHGSEFYFLTQCWEKSLPLGTSLDVPYSWYQVFLKLHNHCWLILQLYDTNDFISGPSFINPCLQWIIF